MNDYVQNYLNEADAQEKASTQSTTEKSTKHFVLLKKAQRIMEELEKTAPTGGAADEKLRTRLSGWRQIIQDAIAKASENF